MPIEDIIPEYEGHGIRADKFGTDGECLRKPVWLTLFRVTQIDTKLRAVPQ